MGKFMRWNWRPYVGTAAAAALVVSGCATSQYAQDAGKSAQSAGMIAHPKSSDVGTLLPEAKPAAPAKASPEIAGPLTLTRLMALAVERHPDLAVAQAKAEAARGMLVQAGLYPNPSVGWASEEMGNSTQQAGFQGPFIAQDIVTGGKIPLAQSAASREVSATEWQLVARRFDLLTRVRLAYFDVLTAQRAVEENKKIIKIAEEALAVAEALLKAGTGARPDVLRAEIELSQSRIRLETAQQTLTTSLKLLATAIGVPDLPVQSLEGSLDKPAPRYDFRVASTLMLERSADLRAAQAKVEQAQALLERAQAEAIPNVNLKVRPFYSFPDKAMELTVEASMNLPIFNRNQGNILAAQADVARTGEEARQLELQLVDKLTNAFQRYRNAQQQHERYRTEIIPKATEARDAVLKVWKAGDKQFDYTTVLQAQQTLVQAQLADVQFLSDLWKAASEIAGLLQQEDW